MRLDSWYVEAECRPDRAYDEYSPSTLLHPNGSLVCSLDRQFNNVAARLIVEERRTG